jgi:hypothetical protein
MISLAITIAVFFSNIAAAITETIVTPTPGLGHGKIADIVAMALWSYSIIPS